MAIDAVSTTTAVSSPSSGGRGGGGGLGPLLVMGGVGAAGYLGYRWYQREQVKAALLAEAERLKAQGMSMKDALQNAAAGACTAAAVAKLHIPAAQAQPMCMGAAVIAYKAAELTAKGAKIVGKAVGKGAVKTGKVIGKGAKFVGYTAPKKVIGGTVNTVDRLLSKAVPKPVARVVSKITPKPVAKVAKVTKKVVKKALCLGVFCGLEGADGYEAALAGAAPVAARSAPGRRPPLLVAARRPAVRAARRFPARGGQARRAGGAAYYARVLGG